MKTILSKSITITNPAVKRRGAAPKNLQQLREEALFSLAFSLKLAIENPKIGYPEMSLMGYGGVGTAATRLLVSVWKKSTDETNDFVHGEIRIKKAKRTRIPGTNEYIFGEISKKDLNDMAQEYREERKNKIKK